MTREQADKLKAAMEARWPGAVYEVRHTEHPSMNVTPWYVALVRRGVDE